MKVLQRLLALCLTMLLLIPPLYASADSVPASGDAYYRIQNTWKGFYLYEGADGKVRYGFTAINDASAQWAIETTGDGHKRLKNRATGHYLNGQNVTAAEITKPLESSDIESGWTSDQWDIADVDGKPGEINFIRADHPNWILNVQLLDGFVQSNDWAQKPWGSATWKLEAAETVEPVRIVLPWKGTYLYEDGGKVKYGTPALNDTSSQWFVEDKDGHKTFRNRATGHYINAQSITAAEITKPLDSSAIEAGWTSDLWDIAAAPDGADGINIINVDHPNWIVNAQIQDGFAQSNDWAQKPWGSAVWKLETAADSNPQRIMDSWKGNYLYENNAQVSYGQSDWQDKASHWIVEDSAAGTRLRNLATGRYVSSNDYVGASPLVTVATPGADATWKVESAKDGDGNPVDGFVTLQSASPGHNDSYLNVQHQDGFAQGNNWAQKTWGSAQWKLAAPAAPVTGPVEPVNPYIKIKNNWLQLYLYESDGVVKYGNVAAGDQSGEWLIETVGSVKRIKNRATGHYINLDGVGGARDALKASALADGSATGDWVIEDFQGYKEIRSAGDDAGNYINVENKLKHAQYGVVPREWGSPKWEFVTAQAAAPTYVRLKNSYLGTYLYEPTSGPSVGKVVYGNPAPEDVTSHWSLVPGTQGTLIVNRATGHRMTVEHVASFADPVESLDIDPTWASVQWKVENVAGSDKKVFRNVWKSDWLLHAEDQKGFAQASGIPADWGSAQWIVEAAPEVAPVLPSGYIRISNRATGKYLYENGNNVVLYGTPAVNDAASQWIIRNVDGVQQLENRATGNVMSIEHLRSYLETTASPTSDDTRTQWTIEDGPAEGVYLIRSEADGYEDAYVHTEDGQGYAQYELRSIESRGVQWVFEAASADAEVVPPVDGPANAVTPVQEELNYVRIHDGDTANVLVEHEGGVAAFESATAGDLSAQWLPQDYNGHKRFANRATGHYLTLAGDAAAISEDGSALDSQWSVTSDAGYVTLSNAESGGLLESATGTRMQLEKVLCDARYEGEKAFVYGGASSLTSQGVASGFGAVGAGAKFAVNAEQASSYDVVVRYRTAGSDARNLSIYVNGLKQPSAATFSGTGTAWADATISLPLRSGMNTIALQADTGNVGSGLDIDAITVRGSINKDYRGATLPFTTYEAEQSATNGTVIGPDREFKTFASEASGRKAVTLDATGQYVSFTTTKASNALNLRYIIPDAASGGGTDATLSLYVDGVKRGKVNLTSKYSWVYGKYPWSNDPADGDAHRFYDETHLLIGDVPAGATIRLQKDSDDTASYYVVDFVELEQADAAYGKPSGYLSVTDYGAVANDAGDDTTAFVAAIAAAKASGAGLWVPAGRFELTAPLHVDHVTIRGAGMWHTTLNGAGFLADGSQIKVYDLLLDVGVTARHDELREAGFDGTFGMDSVIQNVWIEHAKAGIWSMRSDAGISTNGLYVGGVRIRDTYADGINFSTGTANSMIEQTHIRNSGDDSIALWSQKMNGVTDADSGTKGNTVRFNTVQLPWLADNVAIFGGRDNKVQDNVLSDTVGFGAGIAVSTRFDPVAFAGTTTVERNTLIRTGGREPNWGQDFGAIWVFTGDKPIDADIVIRNNTALDSTYQGLYINGPYAIANTSHKVLVQNYVIDGTGTWGIHVNASVKGSVDLDNVIVRHTKVGPVFNAVGSAFELRTVDPQPVSNDADFVSDIDSEAGRGNSQGSGVPVITNVNDDAQLRGALSTAGDKDVVIQLTAEGGVSQATFSFTALREAGGKVPGATIVLQSGDLSYSLPANILEVLAAANESLGLAGEGTLTVALSPVADDVTKELRDKAKAAGFSIEGTPISFELTVSIGGQSTTIHSFGGQFVTRTFAVDGALVANHASVVVYDPKTGQFRTVPALFAAKDGKTVVTVNSTTNSLYAVAETNRTFADIAGHWAQSDIALMANKQLVNGDSPDKYAPDRSISRAEFASMLVRALGLDTSLGGKATFSDVKSDAWYAASVATAARFGIVTGLSDGTFRPDRNITRAEMAVMLSRAKKLVDKDTAAPSAANLQTLFSQDYAQIGEWAQASVAQVAGSGIMQGRAANTFAPDAATTRAEAAVVLKRLLQTTGLMN
ncbi:S-layer homology domain-containing protein [Cohnella yongneupensis]|uniref:S-layer homology domain-containing protein n=1 Tax=Cohnella yongneupensis TaxID=425006 RepID=A0ABW0R4I7_9BACL